MQYPLLPSRSLTAEVERQVAAISPVEIGGALVAPASLPPRKLVAAARREGLPTRGLERPEIVARLDAACT